MRKEVGRARDAVGVLLLPVADRLEVAQDLAAELLAGDLALLAEGAPAVPAEAVDHDADEREGEEQQEPGEGRLRAAVLHDDVARRADDVRNDEQ